MEWPQGCLDRECDEEPEEQDLLQAWIDVEADKGQVVEGTGAGEVRRSDVQPDERSEHKEPADETVDEELHGCVGALWASVASDHEVDRYEHRLEEDVEQEQVSRREHADHEGFEDEDEGEVALYAARRSRRSVIDIVPTRQDDDWHKCRGKCHEYQADAVDADRIRDAKRWNPRVVLDELEWRGRGPVEGQRHEDREHEGRQGDDERDLLGQARTGFRKERDDDTADQRQRAKCGQPGERVHESLTKTSASRTMTAPPTMDRA
ncbi:unannotated protein [freshwater metagenome]|uniref:Unannotated protein n=1 Tax=freshwater metagenome TaxID=449393 RepID=A0A6J6STI2_9ZZZZ